MYLRGLSKALSHKDVRDLAEATHFAERRGYKFNTTITIHPKLLDTYPTDLSLWVRDILNKLRIWCIRDRGFGYYAVWVRENYEGDRREHLHIMLYVPDRKRERDALEAALSRWLIGRDGVFKIGQPEYRVTRSGERVNKALTYMLKQMDPRARYTLCFRVRRETKCRETGAPVAAVMGKRCGVSRSLNTNTRDTFWDGAQTGPLIEKVFRPRHPRPIYCDGAAAPYTRMG
jgi:hypothetical protein